MGRTLLAGIVGGIVIFVWGFVSHMFLQVGEMGIKELPNEEMALPALKTAVSEPGLYFFPAADKNNPDDMAAWETKMQAGPRGLLIIEPDATEKKAMSPVQLGTEFGSNVLAALIAAAIASCVCGGYVSRVLVVTGIGLASWASISVSYWNWYWFPWDFTLGQLMGELPGWFVAGLFIAAIAPRCKPKPLAV